jgi:hypothetical protein
MHNTLGRIMVNCDQHTANGLTFMLVPGYGRYLYLKTWHKFVEQLVNQMKVANNFTVRNTLLHTCEKESA